jgi:endogenous inhibitor of DNA gyrase (YacG/DUF329 family)
MKIALAIMGVVLVGSFYIAWLNGVFVRCPHCRKVGSWRFDPAELAVERKDEEGVVESSRQIRICRKCGKRVVDRWSDHSGRTVEKV